MRLLLLIPILLILAVPFSSALSQSKRFPLDQQSISELEERQDAMKAELKQLANFTLRGEAGSIGYRSSTIRNANRPEWIEVDLGGEISIDEIVLVPTLSRSKLGIRSDGFPVEFRILAGSGEDKEGKVIASFTEKDELLPRIAPLIVPCSGIVASWVRIEANQLSSRELDGEFLLQFSELLVFNGATNHALRRPVDAQLPDSLTISSWGTRFLTDGAVPYLMDAGTGEKSLSYCDYNGVAQKPALTVDLNGVHTVSGISLHAIDQSDTIPQSTSGDFGIPRHLQIEGATQADFSDAVLLLDAQYKTFHDISPIMSWNFAPSTQCRYIRLTALEPYISVNGVMRGTRTGFAEIEIFAEGRNIAMGKTVDSNYEQKEWFRPLTAMTDGHNFYGKILSTREWMHQLSRRHDLERELPLVAAQLQQRYKQQQTTVSLLIWLIVLLAAGILFTILIARIIRMRQAERMKERFAADLHDELGASLYAIGLLGSHAKDALDKPKELAQTVHEITALSKRAASTTRYFSALQTAEELHEDLLNDLQRNARRLIANLEYSFTVEGGEFLQSLKARSRSDLFLFFKECLININRHADATEVQIQLKAEPQQIHLRISDNGSGMQDPDEFKLPPSLERRAKLLRAQLSVAPTISGGTCITLLMLHHKRLLSSSLRLYSQ